MESRTRSVLTRLVSLEFGDGLRHAATVSRALFGVVLLTAVFAGFAIAYQLPSAVVGLAGVAVGYLIAERNALRSRIAQWPAFRSYIDWQRVRGDLNDV